MGRFLRYDFEKELEASVPPDVIQFTTYRE